MSETKSSSDSSSITNTPVQSLDDSSAATASKVELTHIYFEPKQLSDVQINYENTAFHLHMVILSRAAVYFKNLLEEKDINKSPIQLPLMKDFNGLDMKHTHLQQLFDIMYMHEPFEFDDVFAPQPTYLLFPLIYLCHYFAAERLEKRLKEIVSEFLAKPNYGYINASDIWGLLICCQDAKWSAIEQAVIQYIADRFQHVQTDLYKLYWPKLNQNNQQQVYLTVLANSGGNHAALVSESEKWKKLAQETAETMASSSGIKETLSTPEWEKIFKDTLIEVFLFGAVRQKLGLS